MAFKKAKKDFTSEDLGKILLLNLIRNQTEDANDINSLHKSIRNASDRKIFNEYVEIQRYLTAFILDQQTEVRRLSVLYLEIYRYWQNLVDAEHAYEALNCQPRIMTRQAYEKLLEENRKELEKGGFSLLEIFQYEMKSYLNCYKDGKKTPYDEVFDKLKEQSINLEIKANYSHNFYSNSDKFSSLDTWFNSYESVNDFATGKIVEIIIKNYEILIDCILNRYSQFAGLKYLSGLPKSRYIDSNLISFTKALKLDILGAKENYENPLLKLKNGTYLWYGVAVIENLTPFNQEKIINDFYHYDIDSPLFANLAENFINNYDVVSNINEIKKQLKHSLKRINGFIYAFYKISRITGVNELQKLNTSKGHNTLKTLTKLFDIEAVVKRYHLLANEQSTEELIKELKAIFLTDFNEKDLFINELERQKVNEIITNSPSKSEAIRLLGNYLTGLQP